MLKRQQQTEKRVILTKEQIEERKLAMERLHPGYSAWELRLGTWIGLILIGRMFLHGLNIILGAESGWMVLMVPVNLLFCFGFYSVCIREQWMLAWVFLLVRSGELGKTLIQTLPSLWYLNFWGDLWWVSTIAVLVLDIGFLAVVACIPEVHRFVEQQRLVYSGRTDGFTEEEQNADNRSGA